MCRNGRVRVGSLPDHEHGCSPGAVDNHLRLVRQAEAKPAVDRLVVECTGMSPRRAQPPARTRATDRPAALCPSGAGFLLAAKHSGAGVKNQPPKPGSDPETTPIVAAFGARRGDLSRMARGRREQRLEPCAAHQDGPAAGCTHCPSAQQPHVRDRAAAALDLGMHGQPSGRRLDDEPLRRPAAAPQCPGQRSSPPAPSPRPLGPPMPRGLVGPVEGVDRRQQP